MDGLDKLYKDKFKDFKYDPTPGAFDKINAQLPKDTNAKKIPSDARKNILSSKNIWFRIAAAIAIFTIVIYAIVEFSSKNELKNTPEQIEANVPKKNTPIDTAKTIEEKKSITPIKKQDKKKIIENNNSLPPMGNPMIGRDSTFTDHK